MLNIEKQLSLNDIGLKNNSDKSSNYHNYLVLYDTHFNKFRNEKIKMLEIGILFGDSLNIFHEYFEKAIIYAIDIEDKNHLNKERTNIIKGDQSDRSLLNKFENEFFEIIIDDGSHKMNHQQISFGSLFKKLKSGGIYVIEDLHTSHDDYRENIIYGNTLFGIESDNRTIDFLNGFINDIRYNKYLTEEEYSYICENLKSVEIIETHRKNNNEFSITSIIKKK